MSQSQLMDSSEPWTTIRNDMVASSLAAAPHGQKASFVCLIVTGASRGLGRAIAATLCRYHHRENEEPHSFMHAVLVARSATGLESTADVMRQQWRDKRGVNYTDDDQSGLTLSQVPADLGDLDQLDATIDEILEDCSRALTLAKAKEHDSKVVFINNAGSLGPLGPCVDTPLTSSLREMRQAVDLNVTGALWMSARFGRYAAASSPSLIQSATIVNISSLCAVQPMATMALYSAGKAARDAYHTAWAAELASISTSSFNDTNNNNHSSDTTNIRILNYAPGPLETDMATTLRESEFLDANLKPHFQKTLIDPMDSAAVLCQLLQDDTFDNGAHVDFYDCGIDASKTFVE